ncbi:MAG: 50S ribosomal protein L18e [Thermoplasmata archaeon]
MLKTILKEDPELRHTLIALRRAARDHKAPVWGAVARGLARPRHRVIPVNLGHLDRLAPEGATVVVPGKVLAAGELRRPLTVAAFHFSAAARQKIHAAGGSALTIVELLKARPDGSGVRIYG